MKRLPLLKIANIIGAAACIAVAAALWLRPLPPAQVLVTAAAAVPAGHDTPTPGTNVAEEQLRTILPGIDRPSISFDDAVKELEDVAHVQLHVRWPQLEPFNVSRSSLIDLHVPPESSLRDALRNISRELNRKRDPDNRQIETIVSNGAVDPLAVDFQTEDGQIVISVIADLSEYKTTIVYNVRDILDATVSLAGPRQREAAKSRQEAVDRLIKLLTDQTGISESFSSGFVDRQSAIHDMMGLLVVTLSPRQQEIIAAILQALREGSRELPPASRPVFEQ